MAGLTPCPECGSPSLVLESKIARRGTARRRRHQCQGPLCGHRWTTWATRAGQPLEEPPLLAGQHRPRRRRPECRVLTAQQVRVILMSPTRSLRALASQLGVSRETVRKVRLGLFYADVLPDLPRQRPGRRAEVVPVVTDGPSCERCRSWRDGQCREGFPDPLEEGVGFAADCDFYDALPVSQSMSRA